MIPIAIHLILSRYIYRERRVAEGVEHARGCLRWQECPLSLEALDRILYRLRDAVGRQHFRVYGTAAHRAGTPMQSWRSMQVWTVLQ